MKINTFQLKDFLGIAIHSYCDLGYDKENFSREFFENGNFWKCFWI